ncbi:TIGR02301 family protein [Pinisolibacter sp.]|uniref:TIGR02301 family protein n=1 Tax=Pinisolibacter sp. TaxID=2172024 RepID=UPI002FDDB4BF
MRQRPTDHGRTARRGRSFAARFAVMVVAAMVAAMPVAARAQEIAPYDDKLMRLAEILGALHHLRPLCGATDEAQTWRDQMTALVEAEQPSPERARRLVESFNHSYRGLAATHHTCTDTARTLIERYTAEGAALAQEVVVRWGRS